LTTNTLQECNSSKGNKNKQKKLIQSCKKKVNQNDEEILETPVENSKYLVWRQELRWWL
jgi:hypothetical protein